MNPATPSNGLLLVFLSGTGAAPAHVQPRAALGGRRWRLPLARPRLGQWLRYRLPRAAMCSGPAATTRRVSRRRGRRPSTATTHTPKVTIGVTDSVLNRLIKALTYLDKTYPERRLGRVPRQWPAGLEQDRPRRPFQRLGRGRLHRQQRSPSPASRCFRGPSDSTGSKPNFTAATWMTGTLATPASLWYAFGSERDVGRQARSHRPLSRQLAGAGPGPAGAHRRPGAALQQCPRADDDLAPCSRLHGAQYDRRATRRRSMRHGDAVYRPSGTTCWAR